MLLYVEWIDFGFGAFPATAFIFNRHDARSIDTLSTIQPETSHLYDELACSIGVNGSLRYTGRRGPCEVRKETDWPR
jgi:hypothetical protein